METTTLNLTLMETTGSDTEEEQEAGQEHQKTKVELHKTDENKSSDAPSAICTKVERFFKLRERGSTWGTEIRAGCVTFVTMAYILAVNASIISDTGGPCKLPSEYDEGEDVSPFFECKEIVRLDLITATAVGACLACLVMGFAANMPLGLAPSMGINSYFTFAVVGPFWEPRVKYEVALFAVFVEGWILLLLSVCNLRSRIAALIPKHLRSAITCGIGLFLALIGLQADQGIALVVSHGATNLTLGGCGHGKTLLCNEFGLECGCADGDAMTGATTWLGIIGFIIMMVCVINKIKGGIFFGILFVSFVSWFRNSKVTYFPNTADGDARFEYFKKVVNWHGIEKTFGVLFNWNVDDWNIDVIVAAITLFCIHILDTAGSLYSMAALCGLMDEKEEEKGQVEENNETVLKRTLTFLDERKDEKDVRKPCCGGIEKGTDFPRSTAAFCSDAIGTIIGAALGTSNIGPLMESVSGINEGGKTGITAIVIGILFLFSLFLNPIFASIPPWATGPVLVLIGAFMMGATRQIDWENYRQSIPAFMTMIIMPFTYSIAYGIIAGLFLHFIILSLDKIFSVISCLFLHIFGRDKNKYSVVDKKVPTEEEETCCV